MNNVLVELRYYLRYDVPIVVYKAKGKLKYLMQNQINIL